MFWILCRYHAEMNSFLEQQWRTLERDHLHGGWTFGQQCSCAFCLNGKVIRCVAAYLFMDSPVHTSAHQGFFWVSFLSAIETNTESLICTIPGWSGTDLVVHELHRIVSILEKDNVHCPCWNRYLLGLWICLSCTYYFCPNYHPWMYRMPYLLS